jgi:F-type H+-transporting ATPase subunit b
MGVLAASSPLTKIIPGLMIWTVVFFLLTFWILKRFAFAPIQKAIDERRDRIRKSIEEADKAREEARKILEEHRALMREARSQAEEILTEARRTREAMETRMREETEAERQRRLEETRREIQAETQRALEAIRREVAELTLVAATKVTGKTLTDEDDRRLIDEAIASLDFSRLEERV